MTRAPDDLRTVEMAFVVLPARSDAPADDALLYLPGGPGQDFSSFTSSFLGSETIARLRARRDVVLIDPRGSGLSRPRLCPALDQPELVYPTLFGEDWATVTKRAEDAFRGCRTTLDEAGIDPDAFGAADVADDVEALRVALGYRRWTIRGHSYGSRFAQEVLRRNPDTVRAAILSGVWPARPYTEEGIVSMTVAALEQTLDDCAASEPCRSAFPDLKARTTRLLDRLADSPIPIDFLGNPVGRPLVLDASTLLAALVQLHYAKGGVQVVPLLLHTLDEGETQPIASLVSGLLSFQLRMRHDMRHITMCNDDPYRDNFDPALPVQGALARAIRAHWSPRAKSYWGIELHCDELGIPPPSSEPVEFDGPVLLLSGRYDTLTPPRLAQEVAAFMPRHVERVVPDRGHDASDGLGPLVANFVEHPDRPPDLEAVAAIEPLRFETDVRVAPGLARTLSAASAGELSRLLAVAACAALLLTGVVGLPISALRRSGPSRPPWLTWACAGLGVAFLAGLAAAVASTSNPFVLAFGLPGTIGAVLVGPYLLLTLLGLAILREASSWRRGPIAVIATWLGAAGLVVAALLLDLV